MKKIKIIYWASTIIISLLMLFSAYSYLTNNAVKAGFVHLGFPSYFRVELALAKIAGAIILLVPFVPATVKQFTYAGFAITFISAFIAHVSAGDAVSHAAMPVIFLGVLAVSWIYYSKINAANMVALR